MPPRQSPDDLGIGQPEHSADNMSQLMSAVSSLTNKVQMLQIDLESQKQINQELARAPANQPSNPVQRRFWEDPLSVHLSLNPKHVTLAFNGQNYLAWLEAFGTTIQFDFKIPMTSMDSFLPTLTANDDSSVKLILLQTIDDSTKNLISKTSSTLAGIFLAIKRRCDKCARLNKLETTKSLLALIKNDQPRNTAEWQQQHHELFSQLVKWEVTLDEFYGLIVQSDTRVPAGANASVFELLIHQCLNGQNSTPTFDKVSEAIQAAEATAMVAVPAAIIDHGASVSAASYYSPGKTHWQPISAHNPIYQAPQPSGSPSPPQIPNKMVKKAGNFRGRGQSKSLIDQYGSACLYCRKGQHWYADCKVSWADVDAGKTAAPNNLRRPAHFLNKGKQKQVFNITSEGIADGVLVDSAAEIHVSGDSPDFQLETLLTSPPTLQLASRNNTSTLTGMGRLRIPTPSGLLKLANVYYCLDIRSTILCLGRLIEDGYKPVFNGTALQLVSPTNMIYKTSYVKKCWYLDRSNLQVNTISKIPSTTAKSWHEQLGHASNAVVKNFLKRFVPEAKSDAWQDFFCEQCAKSKSTSVGSGPTIQVKISSPLDLLVSDVAGPFDKDPEGNRFLLTLRDHASTYTFTAALKSRSDVSDKIYLQPAPPISGPVANGERRGIFGKIKERA
ncbi:hypothetical protein O181_103928 [Austropuccinia psidii MF-1]|uniref:GAG-pre-integrase domain-containing protein n=1 Tax=Austropuccinia psidii MF-1 TaxID=1389203 RepID=A0A9Q3PJH8_9BASI|nr:hypothetical protein [Austropuccinia psidii MF-1]